MACRCQLLQHCYNTACVALLSWLRCKSTIWSAAFSSHRARRDAHESFPSPIRRRRDTSRPNQVVAPHSRQRLEVFDSRRFAEKVIHLSNARASSRTSSPATRWATPRSISSARRAASCNQSCAISSSDRRSRLESSCSARSARSRTGSDKASRRMVSDFMVEKVALPPAGFNVEIHRRNASAGMPSSTAFCQRLGPLPRFECHTESTTSSSFLTR